MAIVVLFLLVTLPLVAVAQIPEYTTIDPVIIPGAGANSCPSLEQRQSAHQRITSQVASMLSGYISIEQCGDGLWYPLVSINMSDPTSQCLVGWVEEGVGGVRACGRGTTGASCNSVFISSGERDYTKVCGRAIGYQYGHTDAFAGNARTINGVYVDGLSITYGSPRQHLWTFASAVREGPSSYTGSNCPCSSYPGASPPSFLGNNWYCESGNPNPITPSSVLSNDPLWDGKNCEGTCCSNGKSPPWFNVELSGTTSEDIETRICANEHSDENEDVFIKLLEIYIQ